MPVTFKETKTHGYYQKVDQEITVHFLDGKAIKGKLTFIGVYEIFLEVLTKDDAKSEITIFKGAIKYIN